MGDINPDKSTQVNSRTQENSPSHKDKETLSLSLCRVLTVHYNSMTKLMAEA